MAQGHWFAACQGFEKIRGYVVAPGYRDWLRQVDLWIAHCYGQLGDSDQQIDALRRAVKTDPFSNIARANLANVLLSTGNVDQAISESRELIDLSHIGTPGLMAMARILIQRNLQQTSAGRDWRPVEKMIDDAEKAMPDSVEILILREELLVAQNRIADAEALLQKAKSKTPRQAEVWTTLIALAERQQDWTKTEQLLRESQKFWATRWNSGWHKRNLSCGERTQKPSTACKTLGENVDRFSYAQRTQLWNGLAAAAMLMHDTQQARQLRQRIAEKDPDNVQIRYQLLDQALRGERCRHMQARRGSNVSPAKMRIGTTARPFDCTWVQ